MWCPACGSEFGNDLQTCPACEQRLPGGESLEAGTRKEVDGLELGVADPGFSVSPSAPNLHPVSPPDLGPAQGVPEPSAPPSSSLVPPSDFPIYRSWGERVPA